MMETTPTTQPLKFEDFVKVDLRVATILEAVPVPDTDKLVQLNLDVGELGQRTIVAGVRLHYSQAALVSRQIIIAANLEPRKMRGIMSHGMLLAASDDVAMSLLGLDKQIKPGSKVQ